VTTSKEFDFILIYDLGTKTVTQWPTCVSGYMNTYLDLPTRPAKEIFNAWISRLMTLQEVPWWSRSRDSRMPELPPPGHPAAWVDGHSAGLSDGLCDEDAGMLAQVCCKEHEAKKKLFVDYGWRGRFRAEEFNQAQEAWDAEMGRLNGQIMECTMSCQFA
jgi:hypothetical protein